MIKSTTNVLISGGSGTLGKSLTNHLLKNGCNVAWLSRKTFVNQNVRCFVWNPEQNQIPAEAMHFADVVINLAGASVIGQRWTNSYKQQILQSRLQATKLLVSQVLSCNKPIKTFISASAIGIYGNNTQLNLTEEDGFGDNFLADVCQQWENATMPLANSGTRLVVLRIGNVLSQSGGFLAAIKKPISLGLGACLGTGKQYTSWIHEADLASMVWFAMQQNQLHGIYNAVAGQALTNQAITKTIASHLHKPLWLPPIPIWVLRLVLGQSAKMVVASQHVSNQKIVQAGFTFQFQTFDDALKDLLVIQ